jgi:hypothetical protein
VAKGPLIGEPQVRPRVGERETDPDMRGQRPLRIANEHLAAHAHVGQQRLIVANREPKVLASPLGAHRLPPSDRGREPDRACRITPDGARMQHLRCRDRPPDNVTFQARADGLDLGQLRHLRLRQVEGCKRGLALSRGLTRLCV